MCYSRLPWLAAFCSAAVCCFAAEEFTDPPSVSVSLQAWSIEGLDHQTPSDEEKEFAVELEVSGESPWNVMYCEEDEAALNLADSRGSSCSKAACHYGTSDQGKTGTISVHSESWMPSVGAKWVEIQGKIPLVMSRTSAVSEHVTLKLAKGESVPLVLPGAGLDGGDVNAEVKIEKCREEEEEEGRMLVWIRVSSPVEIVFLTVELQSVDGTPLLSENYGSDSEKSDHTYSWCQVMALDGVPQGTSNVSVRYATGLKKVMVPVDVRFGLFGVMEAQDTPGKGALK